MEMCRVCLATERDVSPIDENFVINYNLLTNLNVSLFDGLPQYSCQTCLEAVKSFIEFREKSITSETTLRKGISTGVKEENETNIFKIENENKLIESDTFKIENKPKQSDVIINIETDHTLTVKSEIKLEEQEPSLDNFVIGFEDEFENNSFLTDNEEEIEPLLMEIKKTRKKISIKKKSVRKSNSIKNIPTESVNQRYCEIEPLLMEIKKTRKKISIKKKSVRKSNSIKNIPTESVNQRYCGICPKTFDSESDLRTHIEVHQTWKKCGLCQESLNSPSQVFAHRILHVPKNQHACHICNKKYKSCLYLEFHYRNLHIESDEPRLSCKYCGSKYDKPKKLSSHYVQVHSDIKYVCDVCSKGFHNRANLKSHIKSHSDKKTFVCDLCGFRCKHGNGLKDHKIRKHSAWKVICKVCKRPFESPEEYDKHKKTCKSKITVCPICGRQIKGRLSKHMISHNATPTYECKRCPAKFKTKSGLLSHLDRHDGNRTKQCEYCPAKFYTAAVLIKHRRVHTGEKPYVCKVCNKGFTANFNLKVHMKVHGEYLVVKKQEELTNVTV